MVRRVMSPLIELLLPLIVVAAPSRGSAVFIQAANCRSDYVLIKLAFRQCRTPVGTERSETGSSMAEQDMNAGRTLADGKLR